MSKKPKPVVFVTVKKLNGTVTHLIVEREVTGPYRDPAICGTRPGDKSGWAEDGASYPVTCKRCVDRSWSL